MKTFHFPSDEETYDKFISIHNDLKTRKLVKNQADTFKIIITEANIMNEESRRDE